MSGIELYSTTAGSNNSAPPNGWPEGQTPSSVNDCARQMMAAIRTWYEDAEWINFGNTPTYVSGTSFTVATDLTTRYQVGRRIKLVGTTPFTLYATITTSVYSAPNTTITLTMDSGTIDSTISAVSVGIISITNKSISTNNISGLGTMSAQNANAVAITGGSITGITDLVVADGGTGVSSLTAYAPLYGGTTTTGAIQSGTVGTIGQVLTSNGAAALPTFQTPGATVAFNSIAGFLPTSIAGSNTTASLTIATGQAADSTNAVYISKASTTSWAVSNGNAINGYQGGTTLPNSSTIHFFIITGASGTATFASTSLTPTPPTGYAVSYRRIFSLNTTGAGALIPGVAIETDGGSMLFYLTTQLLDISTTTLGTSQTLYPLTVPSGIRVSPLIRSNIATNGAAVIITSGDETDVAPATVTVSGFTATPGYDLSFFSGTSNVSPITTSGIITTNTSAQIGARSNIVSTFFYLVTRGFKDFRTS